MTNIAVTFEPNAEDRKILTEILGSVAQIIFIKKMAPEARARELARADVLISWSPARELQPEEFKLISNTRMMQLLSAGADHIPFSRLPPGLLVAANVGAYAEPMAEHVIAMILAVT